MARSRPNQPATEPVPHDVPELDLFGVPSPGPLVRRIGRLRLPIAGPYRPWATLYRLPDGKEIWCVGLWELDRPVRRCVSTSALLEYLRASGLRSVEHLVLDLLAREG